MSDVDEVAVLTCTHCDAPVHLTGRNRIVNTDGTLHTCETAAGVREKGGSDRTREGVGVGEWGRSHSGAPVSVDALPRPLGSELPPEPTERRTPPVVDTLPPAAASDEVSPKLREP